MSHGNNQMDLGAEGSLFREVSAEAALDEAKLEKTYKMRWGASREEHNSQRNTPQGSLNGSMTEKRSRRSSSRKKSNSLKRAPSGPQRFVFTKELVNRTDSERKLTTTGY